MALQLERWYMSVTTTVSNDGKVVTIHVSGRFDFALHQGFPACIQRSIHVAKKALWST